MNFLEFHDLLFYQISTYKDTNKESGDDNSIRYKSSCHKFEFSISTKIGKSILNPRIPKFLRTNNLNFLPKS